MLAMALGRGQLRMEFWDEPSQLRPDGDTFFAERAFHNWLFSASQFLNNSLVDCRMRGVVTHGFSTLPILKMVESQNLKIDHLVLVSPYVDIYAYQRRLVDLSIKDFLGLKEMPVVTQLKNFFGQSRQLFDWPMQQALQIAFHDPCLFDHLWYDLNYRDEWLGHMEDREAQLDLVSWQAVNQDIVQVGERLKIDQPLKVPALIIVGESDPIVKTKALDQMLSPLLANYQVKVFPRAGHFPHLEQPDQFVKALTLESNVAEMLAS